MIDATRSKDAPPSLGAERGWRGDDVLTALHRDFLGKCYLTESPLQPGSFEVDHRHPQAAGGASHDWPNLYPCAPGHNQRRRRGWPDGGLLHPDGRDRVEERIDQRLDTSSKPGDVLCVFEACDPNDPAAVNTAAELDHIHNDGDSPSKAHDLRGAMRVRLELLLREQHTVRSARHLSPPGDLQAERRLRELVSRRSPFTALLRSKLHPSLHDLLD